ncbi:MAG: hypothetical protein WCP28_17440 [Actinomycetes bacterium]
MNGEHTIPIGDARHRVTVQPDAAVGETFRDANGNLLDDAYADRAAAEVEDFVSKHRGGRPSLGGDEGTSPLIQFRVTAEQKEAIAAAAELSGVNPSQWLRRVVEQALHEAS